MYLITTYTSITAIRHDHRPLARVDWALLAITKFFLEIFFGNLNVGVARGYGYMPS